MQYAYYPGCSLEHTGKPYDVSIRAIFSVLGVDLIDIEDWNCCGATMYMSAQKTVGYALSARNLAIAAKMGLDVCAPCSSCYTILRKTNRHIKHIPSGKRNIAAALAAGGLTYDDPVEVRHPLDILVNDIGLDVIADKVKTPLKGLKVAPYYGCQIVRPHGHFDDVDDPVLLDQLLTALGAEVVEFPTKTRCCGGMLMMTDQEVALDLSYDLLKCAQSNGATVVATACPLCQLNLEAYQADINKMHNDDLCLPVIYFSQLVAQAFGLAEESTSLNKMLVPVKPIKRQAKTSNAEVSAP